ncbi:MAG TPA: transaldolase family protein [Candidatus Sulfomarinibacteraceae bacterium]|nr:transaldolase family protein [Candidatus Sulfomarinibacteraceae bacterium]
MVLAALDSPLRRMTRETPTQYWNDSCAVEELAYAVERGATGATSNPSIVLEVLKKEADHWVTRVHEVTAANPTWSELDITWAIVEEMAVRGAAVLQPVFEQRHGLAGRLSLQINPANHRHPARMVEQAIRFHGLAPNMQVKFPATAAGLAGIEEATARGVSINATVSFTVPQAIAAAEAVERGLARRVAAGEDTSAMSPIVTIMIGRLDDWMKVLVERDNLAVHPDAPNWAGIAAFKRAYAIFRERGYRSRLLAAAYRHRLHWTELVGGDVSMTMPHAWQVRFNASGIVPQPRMDVRVDPDIVADLYERVPDFRRAYEPDGLSPEEFEGYGATARTLRAFIKSYHDLQGAIRDIILPDPDVRTR